MLELKHITKVYEAGTTQVEALKGIDIAFRENEFVAILGQSGCGKTTLGKSIIQLVKATDGTMMYDFGPQHGGKKDLRQLNREDVGPLLP